MAEEELKNKIQEEQEKDPNNDEINNDSFNSPTTVSFPYNVRTKQPQHPPLKLEVEDKGINRETMWQIYALGGVLIARWLWARWQERRRARRRNEGDDADNNLDESANHRPNL